MPKFQFQREINRLWKFCSLQLTFRVTVIALTLVVLCFSALQTGLNIIAIHLTGYSPSERHKIRKQYFKEIRQLFPFLAFLIEIVLWLNTL